MGEEKINPFPNVLFLSVKAIIVFWKLHVNDAEAAPEGAVEELNAVLALLENGEKT